MSKTATNVMVLSAVAAMTEINKTKSIQERNAMFKEWRKNYVAPSVQAALGENNNVEAFINACMSKPNCLGVFGIKPYDQKTKTINKVAAIQAVSVVLANNSDVVNLVEAIALGNVGPHLAINYQAV